jgi:hypothetical protein
MKRSRVDPGEVERLVRDEQRHRERAAGQAPAIEAVAGIDDLGRGPIS